MKKAVHVVGMGAISAIGHSLAESLHAFKSRQDGISGENPFAQVDGQVRPCGAVSLDNTALAEYLKCDPHIPRTTLLGLHAVREALTAAGIEDRDSLRCGLISATTVGGMDKSEHFFRSYLQDPEGGDLREVRYHACGESTRLIAEAIGHRGFISTINTACSSSVNSIILGTRMIRAGKLDLVIAGGSDALTRFTLNGFQSLMILDGEACRPMDAQRKGLNLGEGAGFMVLVSDALLQQRGLRSLALVSGFANTNDAFHQTASSPEGRGSFQAMLQALELAGLEPGQIDYLNLHGTGTLNNDATESAALRRLFGDELPPLSSTKTFTGHCLGASGGLESVFSVLALQEGCLLPHLRFSEAIPETGIAPQMEWQDGLRLRHVMSNSFGFGGNCSSIIFSQS